MQDILNVRLRKDPGYLTPKDAPGLAPPARPDYARFRWDSSRFRRRVEGRRGRISRGSALSGARPPGKGQHCTSEWKWGNGTMTLWRLYHSISVNT